MILEMCYYGDPVLRKKAEPVEEITDEIRQFCADMIETMQHHSGIGLAAPQVGRLLRIFVTNFSHEDEAGEFHLSEPKVFINPVLKNPSDALVERSEGCLSIPKLYDSVVRPLSIDVEAMDLEGNLFQESCYGYQARTRMHENDHLNGVLFVDRIKGKRRTQLEPALRRIKQQYAHKRA
ncbi:MAG: Peptide deformylase [Chlamydiae bacterium]|nr:Peptide deformylase [Chlamydiota bacterium]